MSAVCLKLITILCLSGTALSDPESSGVVWRDFGGAVTIQCRSLETNQETLNLNKGLNKDFPVLFKYGNSDKTTIAPEFTDRLQLNGVFPNVDILIKNLSSGDTGPYWCEYGRFEKESSQILTMKGKGSVLLVVTGGPHQEQECEPSNKNLVLVPVVISAAVLLGIIMVFFTWLIFKTKTLHTTVISRQHATNDVYEDMRGTLRR